MLMEIANSFLLTIMNSLESVPYGIRWICKQIRSLTRVSLSFSRVRACMYISRALTDGLTCDARKPQRKYPEANDYAICSLIGGFFFLRFVNPAIVTPQAYMLIDSLPTSAKHPRRTLTLVRSFGPSQPRSPPFASILPRSPKLTGMNMRHTRPDRQDVAKPGQQAVLLERGVHDVTPAVYRQQQGADEPVPKRPVRGARFLRLARGEFLLDPGEFSVTIAMFSVRSDFVRPDASSPAQTDQYIALSKKDLQISITLNELYNTQSLLVQHLDILVRISFNLDRPTELELTDVPS